MSQSLKEITAALWAVPQVRWRGRAHADPTSITARTGPDAAGPMDRAGEPTTRPRGLEGPARSGRGARTWPESAGSKGDGARGITGPPAPAAPLHAATGLGTLGGVAVATRW